tara:strand:- start:122 stop:367 length:246 start_codon:yes stop_codon:yes gene_type:complete
MKQLVKELYKTILLIICSGLFVAFFYEFNSLDEPTPAKANRIVKEGKNLSQSLTRQERDEYMKYLRALNDSDEKIYKKSAY